MAISTLVFSTPNTLDLSPDATRRHSTVLDQVRQLEAFAAGIGHGGATLTVAYETTTAAVKASGTLTFASVAVGTVLMVNGVRFYAVSGTPLRSAGEFKRGVSNTADAADFVTTFKASTNAAISGVLTASSVAAVVTITAQMPGTTQNAVVIETMGVCASGTVTYSSSSGAQTVVINGVTVYNATGASDAANATAAAAAINASVNALVLGHVVAYANAGVVNIFAAYPDIRGNAITLSATGTGATASVARLAGGTVASSAGAQAAGTWTTSTGSGVMGVALNGVAITVTWATSDTATATALAAAINSSTNALVQGIVFAASALGVVTITAVRGGISGNAITLATSGAGTGQSVSGARLTGGAVPTTVVAAGAAQLGTAIARLSGGKGGGTAPVSITQ